MSAWRSRRRRREAGSEEGHCHCIIAACRGGLPCGRAKVCRGDERGAGERFCGDERSADEEEGVRAAAPAVRSNHVVGWPLPPPRSRWLHILPPARGHNAPPPGAGAVVSLCSKTAPPRHFSQRIGFRPHRNLRGSLRGEFLCSFEGVESQKTLYFQGRKWYNTHIKTKG